MTWPLVVLLLGAAALVVRDRRNERKFRARLAEIGEEFASIHGKTRP